MRVHEPCSSLRERSHLACFARTAPVLSASRRVAKTARSGVLGVHGHCVVSRSKPAVHVHTNLAQACESVFTLRASVGLRRSGAAIHVYTAAAPVLSASRACNEDCRKWSSRCACGHCVVPNLEQNLCTYTNLAQASGVLGVHGHCVVSRSKPAVHVHTNLAQACESVFTLRASVGLRRSGAAIHVYTAAAPVLSASRACNEDCRKWSSRCACGHCVVPNLEQNLCAYTNLAQACESVLTLRASPVQRPCYPHQGV